MSTDVLRTPSDPYRAAQGIVATGGGAGGPAPKRIVVGSGFWIFLLSDVLKFSAFFTASAVLF